MIDFIEEQRSAYGVEPICDVLQIAPSTYYEHRARRLDPAKRPEREHRDAELRPKIRRVWTSPRPSTRSARRIGPWMRGSRRTSDSPS